MSVQLILYPQSYNGQYNHISNVADEKLVDGINFNSINASSSADISSSSAILSINLAITTAAPNIINTWYRYRSTVTGTPALPDASGGSLYLYSVSTDTLSGVYQRLSNLIAGQSYNLFLQFDNTASGQVVLSVYNGNTSALMVQVGTTITTLTASATYIPFTAQTTNDIVQISYFNTSADTFEIYGMSVIPVGQTVTYTNFHLEDGQVICDLYQEEDIPLTLSVDDFKNVAEKVQSYSKDFSLPATKRNNLIFDSIFEITRSDDGIIFNPYIKTQCVLKQDGYILFDGYLRLIDVQDQKGEISYNVNLYSEAVALADVLKDRTFADLDFTELTHDYNKTQIKYSWNSSGTGITYLNANTSGYRDAFNTVKYPFVDWSHQILISNGTNGIINYPELTTLEQAFRPFINIKYLINRIFEATPFTWTSTFFDSADFDKLFMDFNWGSDNTPANVNGSTYGGQAPYSADVFLLPIATASFQNLQLANWQSNAWVTPPNYNQISNILTATQVNETYQIDYDYQVNCSSGDTVDFQWLHTTSLGTNIIDATSILSVTSINYWQGNFTIVMQIGDTLQAQFKTNGSNTWQYSTFASSVIFVQSISAVTSQTFLQTLRGELGQWDF